MSLAEKIGPHLPNLRRFARLLTGRQAAGDAAVARLLEAIVDDPALFPDLPPRIGLYQSFLNAFTARLEDPAAQADEIGKTAARSLAALPPQTRQAFLLVSVEEFDREEAAVILEVSQARVDELLRQANTEIGKQIAEAPHEILLVLDATTGQNGISQARHFTDAVNCTGIVLAKLDGTAKGGVVVAIRQQVGLPVKFVGVGERPQDLTPFVADDFVDALFDDLTVAGAAG